MQVVKEFLGSGWWWWHAVIYWLKRMCSVMNTMARCSMPCVPQLCCSLHCNHYIYEVLLLLLLYCVFVKVRKQSWAPRLSASWRMFLIPTHTSALVLHKMTLMSLNIILVWQAVHIPWLRTFQCLQPQQQQQQQALHSTTWEWMNLDRHVDPFPAWCSKGKVCGNSLTVLSCGSAGLHVHGMYPK